MNDHEMFNSPGHGLTVRHLRKTDTCSGYEELAPIDQNPTYDFNYQQTTFLPRRVKVLPVSLRLSQRMQKIK